MNNVLENFINKSYDNRKLKLIALFILIMLAFVDYLAKGNYLDIAIEFLFFFPVILAGFISLSFGYLMAGAATVILFITNPLLAHIFDSPIILKDFEHIATVLLAWSSYTFAAVIIDRLVKINKETLEQKNQLNKVFLATTTSLCKALDARDHNTANHSKKVAEYSRTIAATMGIPIVKQKTIYFAGLLHDIGKIGIAESYLNKPGRLTVEEWLELKKHPIWGYKIIQSIPGFQDIAGMVLQHHERFDGEGYPNKINGEEISLGARIICVADSFDAMISERIYKPARSREEAVEEIIKNSGKQFDPEVVKAFCTFIENENIKSAEKEFEPDLVFTGQ